MTPETAGRRGAGVTRSTFALGVGAIVASILVLAAAANLRQPAVLASVDLERLYNALDRQAEADAEVQRFTDQLNAQTEQMRRAIDDLRVDLDSFQPGSADYKRLQDELELAAMNFRAQVEFNKSKIEAKRAELIRNIYNQIKEAISSYAQANGIDAVYLDDSKPPIELADPQRTMQQISARRMLYSADALDITDALIQVMNQ